MLCAKILTNRAPTLDPSLIAKKGEQTAYAVRSALGFWEEHSPALNAKILSRYYALLQISIAEQVASLDSTLDLEEIQRHTEAGHGLSTLIDPSLAFPENYLIACLKGGHLYMYCRHKGIDLDAFAFARRPRKIETLDGAQRQCFLSLSDLLRRVPELQPLISECLGTSPLSFQVHSSERNMEAQLRRVAEHTKKTGQVLHDPPSDGTDLTTYVSIYSEHPSVTAEFLNGLGLPFANIGEDSAGDKRARHFDGEIHHPGDTYWHEVIELYKSGYSATSVIAPFWKLTDPFILHLIILYALSIIVRYLPSLWHDIEDGKLNHMRALIEHYLLIVDNVVPRLAVENITGTRLLVVQPGSLFAPS